MSAKPSKLPDPDLSPAGGETQDRRRVGLKKGPITKSAQRAFDDIGAHVEMEQDEARQGHAPPPDDTIIPDLRNQEFLEPQPLKNPTYKYGDKVPRGRRSIPIPLIRNDRPNPKVPISAKSTTPKSAKKPDKHAYKVTYKT